MKLKFPAIFSYAGAGSRGAWTGNALLLTLLFQHHFESSLWKECVMKVHPELTFENGVNQVEDNSCTKALSHVWKETARTK
ncbi:hypothetical protein ABH14_15200 [Brevibacillus brevis]|nr:hypothetical protein [Brevibacillus brevis]